MTPIGDRPTNCRERLRHEGKPYPKSGCQACHSGGLFGCVYGDDRIEPAPEPEPDERLGPLWRKVQEVHTEGMRRDISVEQYRQNMLEVLQAPTSVKTDMGEIVAPIWRNAITNTIVVVDLIRSKLKRRGGKRNAAVEEFDNEIDDALGKWFRFSREHTVSSYDDAERLWKEFYCTYMADDDLKD